MLPLLSVCMPVLCRDAITALSFREGTHTLFSASADRTVKLWSLDDRAYMDALFGHQAEVRLPGCLVGGWNASCGN
jgi:ribosomal RNA-processing protein 9